MSRAAPCSYYFVCCCCSCCCEVLIDQIHSRVGQMHLRYPFQLAGGGSGGPSSFCLCPPHPSPHFVCSTHEAHIFPSEQYWLQENKPRGGGVRSGGGRKGWVTLF